MVKQRELAATCGTGVRHLKGMHERAMTAVEVEEGGDELLEVFRSMEDLCLSGEKIKKQKFAHCWALCLNSELCVSVVFV